MIEQAERDAAGAAKAADVVIENAHSLESLDVVREVMERVWGTEIVPPRNLLRGLALAASTVLLAQRGGRPVGFAIGWIGWDGGIHFHSHQTGVVPGERSAGVGYALKLAQRAACVANGVTEMRWTVDPLLATNAEFNMHRLGAHVVDYLPNCYGARNDAFNTDDITDRIKLSWQLDTHVGGVPLEPVADSPRLIALTPFPVRTELMPSVGALIPIPKRYQQLRTEQPQLAAAWRKAAGSAFADTFAAGLGIAGLSNDGYVVGPDRPVS